MKKNNRNIFKSLIICLLYLNAVYVVPVCAQYYRPGLQEEQIITTDNFKIHYTTFDCEDQCTVEYATAAANYAEEARSILISQGWLPPPSDNSEGGDSLYDIYLLHRDLGNGVTYACVGIAPDPINHPLGRASWIEIRNNSLTGPSGISINDLLRWTIFHEVHHASQDAYRYESGYQWFMENTSVYFQQNSLTSINTLSYFLSDLFPCNPLSTPEKGIDFSVIEYYRYGGGLWLQFLKEYYQSSTIVREIWEYFGSHPSINVLGSIENVLSSNTYQSSMENALKEYSVWRYFTGTRADNYHFMEAANYPTSNVLHTYDIQSESPVSLPVQNIYPVGGVKFIEFENGTHRFIKDISLAVNRAGWNACIITLDAVNQPDENWISLNPNNNLISNQCSDNSKYLLLMTLTDLQYGGVVGVPISFSAEFVYMDSVIFVNQSETSSLGGYLLLDESVEIPSDTPTYLRPSSNHSVKTSNERFPTSPIKKHNNWNSILSDYTLKKDFHSYDGLRMSANFLPLYTTTVQAELIDGGVGGTIQFRDPWYLKSDGTQPVDNEFLPSVSSPYYPTGAYNQETGGVFLEQNPDPQNPSKPYYSIRMPQTQQNINGFVGQFLSWSTVNADPGTPNNIVQINNQSYYQTPVVFQVLLPISWSMGNVSIFTTFT